MTSHNLPKIQPQTKVLIIKTVKTKSAAEGADIFNVSKRQVERIRKDFKKLVTFMTSPGQANPFKITVQEDRLLLRQSRASPFSTAVELHENWCASRALRHIRLFVMERTALQRHGTGRKCPHCGGELRDTVVDFGERGTLEQPLNWKGAAEAAQQADLILYLGSSLKVGQRLSCSVSICSCSDL
ncbi:hypothetical protein AOLI_G00265930 [Acnodon oligacanthus]